MRSSKSRSRSKSNRPRPLGNIINRVFDSSGPDGKVRGTPQQIIDKYLVLARDAQLSNDRVAAENFLQHAEHYTRMLGEAMRETAREDAARRDAAEMQQQQPFRPQRDQRDRDGGRPEHGQPEAAQPVSEPRGQDPRGEDQRGRGQQRRRGGRPADVIDFDEGAEGSTLVETPEARVQSGDPVPPAERAAPASEPDAAADATVDTTAEPAGAEQDGGKPATRRRAPRNTAARSGTAVRAAGAPRKSRKADDGSKEAEPSTASGE